jgi:transposase-like protein
MARDKAAANGTKISQRWKKRKRRTKKQHAPQPDLAIKFQCLTCESFRVMRVNGKGEPAFRCDQCGLKANEAKAVAFKRDGRLFQKADSP